MDFRDILMIAATQGDEAAAGYTANAVDFNGSADWLTKASGLTGAVDGPFGSISLWVRFDGGNGSEQVAVGDKDQFVMIEKATDNKFTIDLYNAAASSEYKFASTTTYTAGATWLNLLASWDLNHVITQKISWMYVNDVSVGAAPSVDPALAMNVAYVLNGWQVGSRTSGGSARLNGCLAELWFAPGQYIDFSQTANRRKFITAGGKPVNLGSDGSTPTGTAPLLYLPNAFGTVATNAGTGGNFTINGSPAACSTSPST